MVTHTITYEDVPVTTIETKKVHVIKLTTEEYELFTDGLGATSETSRRRAGMTLEQAKFFGQLFSKLIEVSTH